MNYKPIFERVAKDLDIPEKVVAFAYRSFWKFIRETIKELPLKEDLTEEEFLKLRTNFNIPSLGKLVCTYDRYIGMKKRYKYLKSLRSRDDKYKKD